MLSQHFHGKDNLCPRAHTAPCTTRPLQDDFQGALGKDISLPRCPAPRMATENTETTFGITIIPSPILFSLFFLFCFVLFCFVFFKSHSLAETTLSHFHDMPCPRASIDSYCEWNNVALRLPVVQGRGWGAELWGSCNPSLIAV